MSTSQPPFFVHGTDGREYPVDGDTLARWTSEKRVTPDQLVFVWAEHRWVQVRDLPQFKPASPSPRLSTKRHVVPILGIGCGTLLVVFVILFVIGSYEQKREEARSAEERAKIRQQREPLENQLRRDALGAAQTVRDRLAAVAAAERKGDQRGATKALAEIRQNC